MSKFCCCQSCGCPGVEPGYSFCGHCADARCHHCRRVGRGEVCPDCLELIADIEANDHIEPPPQPAREPGCDDRPAFTTVITCEREHGAAPNPKPVRDGRWLAWAAAKRNKLHWFHDYGQMCGFDRDIRRWTPDQVEMAVQAIQIKQQNS